MSKVNLQVLDRLIEYSEVVEGPGEADPDLLRMRDDPDMRSDPEDMIGAAYEVWLRHLRAAIVFGGGLALREVEPNIDGPGLIRWEGETLEASRLPERTVKKLIKRALKRAGVGGPNGA